MIKLKTFTGVIGTIGSLIAQAYGGWTTGMTTLVTFMMIDYFTGLIVAGVFKKSSKTKNGALESGAGFKGLCRKGMIFLIIYIAVRLDLILGSNFIKDAVVIAYTVNETISIIENAGLMGLPIPGIITNAIETLKKKSEEPILKED